MLKKKMELRPKLADILSYDFLMPTVDSLMDTFTIPPYVPPPAHTPRRTVYSPSNPVKQVHLNTRHCTYLKKKFKLENFEFMI